MKRAPIKMKKIIPILILAISGLVSNQLLAQVHELWGVTASGGQNDIGVIFKTDGSGNNETVQYSFDSPGGNLPLGKLTLASDGKFYGMTSAGGANNTGVIFQYNPTTSTYTKKFDFGGSSDAYINGANPQGSLMLASDGNLYGMTRDGGTYSYGVLFQYNPTTSTFTKKIDFNNLLNGQGPLGSLMQASDGNLYGMTIYGGSYNSGVLFQYNPTTSAFVVKVNFWGAGNGSYPVGDLMQASDGSLYGMTLNGGVNDKGVLFQYSPTTSTYTKKLDFALGNNGYMPYGSLMQASDGNIYGTMTYGGTYSNGVLFQYNPSTSSFTKKLDFASASNGSYPRGTLMQASDGNLYGTASGGTAYNGVLFQYNPSTSVCTKKLDFDNAIGTAPGSSVIEYIAVCNVNIPDANFKAALIANTAINTNLDAEIQCSEAAAYTGTITVNNLGISDLTGIEAFTSITSLNCSHNLLTNLILLTNTALTSLTCNNNLLTSIDVSSNTNLTYLMSGWNQLANLDVSFNTNLTYLECAGNLLTNINVSANTALSALICYSNQLSYLDVYANTALTAINCSYNQLTYLDLSYNSALTEVDCYNNPLLTSLNVSNGHNTIIAYFNAYQNPVLTCIQVDNVSYSTTHWTVGANIDATASFSTNCSPSSPTVWYLDADGDGYGNLADRLITPFATPGYVADSTDCDDTDNTKYQSIAFYIDADGDGYDNGSETVCFGATAPAGYSVTTAGSDCDDTDNTIHTTYQFYVDTDDDGYGVGSLVSVCAVDANTPPSFYSLNNTDCDDNDNTKYRSIAFYIDADGDGYDNGSETVCFGATAPAGYSVTTAGSDCDDTDNTIHTTYQFYVDTDDDGYGVGSLVSVCAVDANTPPSFYSLNNTDCDDNDNTKYRSIAFYIDADGDGYDNGIETVCFGATAPAGYSVTTAGSDCNDNDPSVHAILLVGATASANTVCAGTSITLSGTGATSYSWSGGITNGEAFTPSSSGTYTVTGTTNGCTNTATETITVNALPNVGSLSSLPSVCAGSQVSFIGTGAMTYSWSGGITDGVAFTPLTSGTYTVTGTNFYGCTNTATQTITVTPAYTIIASAGTNGSISPAGTSSFCGGNQTYTISPLAGYNIASVTVDGNNVGTNATYTFTAITTNHTISATFVSNGGGCPLPTAPVISGPIVFCGVPHPVYSATSSGATSFNWTVPAGITTFTGQGTSSITTTVSGTSTGSNIMTVTCTAINTCGSTPTSFTISKKPQTPTTITGPLSVCGLTTAQYSIPVTFGATSYTWTVPTGMSIVSGAGTIGITVSIATTFVGGAVKVTANNACGYYNATSLSVYGKTAPSSITGPSNVCGTTTATYTCSTVPNATSYFWTIPSTWSIVSGQNTNTIVVHLPTNVNSINYAGSVRVQAISACGTSNFNTITVNYCKSLQTVNNTEVDNNDFMSIYPNPASTEFIVSLNGNQSNLELEIYDVLGNKVINTLLTNETSTINIEQLSIGLYFVRLTDANSNIIYTQRLVKE